MREARGGLKFQYVHGFVKETIKHFTCGDNKGAIKKLLCKSAKESLFA